MELLSALGMVIVVFLGSLSLKMFVSQLQDKHKKLVKKGVYGASPILVLAWLYAFIQLYAYPAMQDPDDVINSIAQFDNNGVAGNSVAMWTAILLFTQVAVEMFTSAGLFLFGRELRDKHYETEYRPNPKYQLLEAKSEELALEIGSLKSTRNDNQAYIDFINNGRAHFIAKAMSEFAQYRAELERIQRIADRENEAYELIAIEEQKQQEVYNQQRDKILSFMLQADEAHQSEQERLKQKRHRINEFASQLRNNHVPKAPVSHDTNNESDASQKDLPDDAPAQLNLLHLNRNQSGFATVKFLVSLLLFATLLFTSIMANATTNVFVVSDSLSKQQASQTMRAAITTMTKMELDDRFVLYDGTNSQVVATADLSSARRNTPKAKVHAMKSDIAAVKNWLSQAISDEATGRLFLPQTVKEFGLSFPFSKDDVRIFVVGNPMYHDDASEASLSFSMESGYIPSDGHLRAKPQESPFAVEAKYLHKLPVHFVSLYDKWIDSTYHQKHVHRWWDLWVGESGGILASFSSDFDITFERFLSGAKREADFKFNESDTKLLMKRFVQSTVMRETESWLGNSAQITRTATQKRSGRVKMGITWTCVCDLDLHARGHRRYQPLYFRRHRTQEGHFFKDVTTTPNVKHGYERIEFSRVIDLAEAEVRVNFYSGNSPGGVRGTFRLWLDGQVYSQDFVIPAESGNRGRQSLNHWVTIDLESVVSPPSA